MCRVPPDEQPPATAPEEGMPPEDSFLNHARRYASAHGWSVVPVRGKKPACRWERYQADPPRPRQLQGLFSLPNLTGLGVVLGRVSNGLRVRDFDREDSYRRWADHHPDLAAALPTVRTLKGFHVYFRAEMPDAISFYD